MSDLVEFLRARLDEDEATARGAWPERWDAADRTNRVQSAEISTRAGYAESGLHDTIARIDMTIGKYEVEVRNAAHIARWDPARVLAEVEAKRRIVDRYDANLDRQTDPEESHLEADINVTEYEDWTLIALAQPYADHPDFDPAWRLA